MISDLFLSFVDFVYNDHHQFLNLLVLSVLKLSIS